MTDNTVVEYQRLATDATFAVLLTAEPPGQRAPLSVSLAGIPYQQDARLRIVAHSRCDEIAFSVATGVTVRRMQHDQGDGTPGEAEARCPEGSSLTPASIDQPRQQCTPGRKTGAP
jgi:hypothetical protein